MDFILNILIEVFLAFFWILGLIAFLLTEKNKKKFKYLIILVPILTIWAIYSCINILKPRFQDIKYYTSKNYKIDTGKCSKVNNGGRTTPSFVLENKTFYYSPWVNKVSENKRYKVEYLPNSRYVISVEKVE